MKTRRLSEIDLARFCALPSGEPLRHALRLYNSGGGAWSYDPIRNSTADALSARTALLGPMKPLTWAQLCRQVERACTRGEEQRLSNVELAAILYHYAGALEWETVKLAMGRLAIGMGEAVRYWGDIVVDDGAGPFIPFFDHRRAHGLSNPDIRRIVFSFQDIHVRQQFPDLADARLAIVQFPTAGHMRSFNVHFDDGMTLMSFDELNEKVSEVYREWAGVQAERDDERRRATGTGGTTPLGF